MPRFAILMYEDDHAWARLPKPRQEELLALYGAYVEDLKAREVFVGGNAVGGPITVLTGKHGGAIETALSSQTMDVLTGWFVVEAPDMNAAVALAKGCPALLHGERVHVRPTGHA